MKAIKMSLFALFFLLASYCRAHTAAESLVEQIAHIAIQAHCRVGVAAIYLESGETVAYNGNTPFFMASTVKLPFAIALLHRVDLKQDRLSRIIVFEQRHSVPGSGSLFNELSLRAGPHRASLLQLLRLMLVISDNTAADLVLNAVKGPQAVSRQMHAFGFSRIIVNRSIFDLYLSTSGAAPYTAHYFHDTHKLSCLRHHIRPEKKVEAWMRFQLDKHDTTTANEMARLLAHLYQGKMLSPTSTRLLLDIMSSCETGGRRIKGLLPPGAKVAHKTGTWTIFKDSFVEYPGSKRLYRFANDIGIITLPNHTGHIAIAVYVKSRAVEDAARERVIAQISRKIYDYFLRR